MPQFRSIIFLILYFLSFSYTTICQNTNNNNELPKTFIVSIQNDLKPNNILNHKEWYKSILSNITLNSNVEFIYVYATIFHGFSTKLTSQQVESLKARPEVLTIIPDEIYQTHTTRTPHFLGLDSYSVPTGLLKESNLGSNVVIGVLDTGIWPKSLSFNDNELDPIPSQFKGKCDGGKDFEPSLCNKKIIGVRYFSIGMNATQLSQDDETEILSAWDHNGHGTHTASTAAGRARTNASFFGYASGDATGIAPKARLAIYKVCWTRGCVTSDVLAALDKAVEDGVDVISISLGGPPRRYHLDSIAIAAFAAAEKGVFVSASAGNAGPLPGRVGNNAPWMTTVGASSIDRTFPARLILDNGETLIGSSLFTSESLPQNETFPIVHFASNWSKANCLPNSLDTKEVNQKIVVCQFAGMYSEPELSMIVKKVGGVGIIVTSNPSTITKTETLVSRPYIIPGLTLGQIDSIKILNYTSGEKQIKGTIIKGGTEIGQVSAPVVADFSSRGPSAESMYVLKPDIIAPGLNILAAWPNDVPPTRLENDARRSEFNIISGTSMSCPHVSGVAALLKGAHPDWSPAMIRSAIMTTAYKGYKKVDPLNNGQGYGTETTPWDIGAGHVNPQEANDPGLVFDITMEDYINFLCASNYSEIEIKAITKKTVTCEKTSYKPWDLNYPAIVVNSDQESVVTRTLTNVGPESSTYIAKMEQPEGGSVVVEPMKLSFETKGTKQNFTVKVSPSKQGASSEIKRAGLITWSDGKHNVSIPVIVYKE